MGRNGSKGCLVCRRAGRCLGTEKDFVSAVELTRRSLKEKGNYSGIEKSQQFPLKTDQLVSHLGPPGINSYTTKWDTSRLRHDYFDVEFLRPETTATCFGVDSKLAEYRGDDLSNHRQSFWWRGLDTSKNWWLADAPFYRE